MLERFRTYYLGLGLSVGIAIALSGCYSPEQREANRAASEARFERDRVQAKFDRTYDSCLYRVTGPFAAASIEVMRECDRQARVASRVMLTTSRRKSKHHS